MERMLESIEIAVPAGRTLRIHRAKGAVLRVVQGTGWITEEGDTEDYALGAGDTRRIGSAGLTLVHAFDAARLVLESASGSRCVTVELGGFYREYAAAVWREQLAGVGRRIRHALRYPAYRKEGEAAGG